LKNIVVIPTYNEIENVATMVHTVMALDFDIDVLIVDDNSPDGTGQAVKDLQAIYGKRLQILERSKKNGLGTAYIAGFKLCLSQNYDFIFEMDCDFSHNPNDLVRLHAKCVDEGFDMTVGSRYVNHLVNVVNWPMGRVLLSYFASMYVRLITRMKIMDTTAGFVCYSSEVLSAINLDKIKFRGYAFQIEMKFTALQHNFKVAEVPIIFTDRTLGESKMSGGIIKEALFGVIQMKIGSWFKKY
jgi:dolichol-phosphate mannosyltransferase